MNKLKCTYCIFHKPLKYLFFSGYHYCSCALWFDNNEPPLSKAIVCKSNLWSQNITQIRKKNYLRHSRPNGKTDSNLHSQMLWQTFLFFVFLIKNIFIMQHNSLLWLWQLWIQYICTFSNNNHFERISTFLLVANDINFFLLNQTAYLW